MGINFLQHCVLICYNKASTKVIHDQNLQGRGRKGKVNIGTLRVQELFFQLIGLLGLRLGVSPVGMVELFVHGASLTT